MKYLHYEVDNGMMLRLFRDLLVLFICLMIFIFNTFVMMVLVVAVMIPMMMMVVVGILL